MSAVIYELAQKARIAGTSNHSNPFTRKNRNPQKPSRFIQVAMFIRVQVNNKSLAKKTRRAKPTCCLLTLDREHEFCFDGFTAVHTVEAKLARKFHSVDVLILDLEVQCCLDAVTDRFEHSVIAC